MDCSSSDRAELAGLERRGVLGQSFFDAILKRTPHRRALAARPVVELELEAVACGLLVPHPLQVHMGHGDLGLAVLQLQPA